MPAWFSTVLRIIGTLLKVYFAFLVFCLIAMAFIFITAIGEKTLVNDTIHLAPGESKSYYLPPGMANVHISSDTPVDLTGESPTSHGGAYGTTRSDGRIGTPFGVNETCYNQGNTEATVNVRITTGVLNPFGYALYGI
jgi:hypothetical protein